MEWGIVAYILTFLHHQYNQKKLRILLIWYLSFFCLEGGLTCYLGAITIPLLFGVNENLSSLLYAIGTLAFTGMLMFACVFTLQVEYARGPRRYMYFGGMSIIGGLLGGVLLTPSQFTLEGTGMAGIQFISLHAPALFLGSLFAGYFAWFATKVFGRMWRENRGTSLRRKFGFIVSGTLIHAFGFFAVLVWGGMTGVIALSLLYPYPSIIGLSFFLKGLKLNPKYLIYLKQKAYTLIVFQPGGDVLFKYRFRKFPAREEEYIIAALNGLLQFLQSTMNIEPQLTFDTIDLHAYKILSTFRKDIGLSLIVSDDSPVFRQALTHLLGQLPPRARDAHGDFHSVSPHGEEQVALDQLVKETFFFYPEGQQEWEAGRCPAAH